MTFGLYKHDFWFQDMCHLGVEGHNPWLKKTRLLILRTQLLSG